MFSAPSLVGGKLQVRAALLHFNSLGNFLLDLVHVGTRSTGSDAATRVELRG
jgi:hypothetical protein